MPVYNTEKYLKGTVCSILNQTYKNFEFLIFNDASEDNSLAVITSFNDGRIKVVSSQQNLGYLIHLNEGLEMAKGKYIVRMDSDDEAYPSRLEEQVRFMENHTDMGLAGSLYVITGGVKDDVRKLPTKDDQLRVRLINSNPFGHPTVIYRKSIIDEHKLRYEPAYYTSEDYKLWYEISKISKIANVPRILLKYRHHCQNISTRKRTLQDTIKLKVQAEIIRETFPELTQDEQVIFTSFLNKEDISNDDFINADLLLTKIVDTNMYYSRKCLIQYFMHIWLRYVYEKKFHQRLSSFKFYNSINLIERVKIFKNLYWR